MTENIPGRPSIALNTMLSRWLKLTNLLTSAASYSQYTPSFDLLGLGRAIGKKDLPLEGAVTVGSAWHRHLELGDDWVGAE